jgi:hypothetical protein
MYIQLNIVRVHVTIFQIKMQQFVMFVIESRVTIKGKKLLLHKNAFMANLCSR